MRHTHHTSVHTHTSINIYSISIAKNTAAVEDCTFMAAFWMGLTDSMCLRAMNGLRMIANSPVAPIIDFFRRNVRKRWGE